MHINEMTVDNLMKNKIQFKMPSKYQKQTANVSDKLSK